MKNIDFNKIEKETVAKFKESLISNNECTCSHEEHAHNHTVALIEMAAEICKVMLQEYHKSLEEK